MEITALVFEPRSPFGGRVSANTLFGAACWGIRKFYGEGVLKEFLNRFAEGEPPLLMSSPLPLDPEGRPWFFRPPLEGSIFSSASAEELKNTYPLAKVFKKITLLDWELLSAVLRGEIRSERDLFEEILKKEGATDGSVKERKEALERYAARTPAFARDELLVKTAINRLTGTVRRGELFNERAFFYGNFAVIFAVFDPDWFEKVKVALRVVRLGGNKTVGMGRFEVKEQREVIPEGFKRFASEGERVYLLSPAAMDPSVELEGSFYELSFERSAVDKSLAYFDPEFLNLPVWKKRTVYFREGSILKLKEPKRFVGGLRETLNYRGKKVYSYGFGFPLVFGGV